MHNLRASEVAFKAVEAAPTMEDEIELMSRIHGDATKSSGARSEIDLASSIKGDAVASGEIDKGDGVPSVSCRWIQWVSRSELSLNEFKALAVTHAHSLSPPHTPPFLPSLPLGVWLGALTSPARGGGAAKRP